MDEGLACSHGVCPPHHRRSPGSASPEPEVLGLNQTRISCQMWVSTRKGRVNIFTGTFLQRFKH